MKKVELVPGIHSSVLGFGCAPILGSVGANKAKRALLLALDNGINHFDIARSYGYGEAEQFVGGLLKPYRKDLVIASKFGIEANNKAKLLSPIKPIVRYLKNKKKKFFPSLSITETTSMGIADSFHNRILLNPSKMNKSLEESLRALKTDYLDFFFIHEPIETIIDIDELLYMGQKLKQEGKIRAFGIAFMQNQKELHINYLKYFDVLQFNNSPGMKGYENIRQERAVFPNIFFSPINGGNSQLSVAEKLRNLHRDFPKSVILCSMFNEHHLISNAKLF